VTVEVTTEQLLTERDGLRGVEFVEAVRGPGFLACLDDDGREVLAELVGVDLEPAMLGALEREGEGREGLRRAEPDEAAFTLVDVRLEYVRVPVAGAAIAPIRGNDQVRVGEGLLVLDLVLESLVHAQLTGALL
jgi:hypothetical protein